MLSRTKEQGAGNQQGGINDVGDDQANRVCVRVPAAVSGVTAVQAGSKQPGSCVGFVAPRSSHCPRVGAGASCVLP